MKQNVFIHCVHPLFRTLPIHNAPPNAQRYKPLTGHSTKKTLQLRRPQHNSGESLRPHIVLKIGPRLGLEPRTIRRRIILPFKLSRFVYFVSAFQGCCVASAQRATNFGAGHSLYGIVRFFKRWLKAGAGCTGCEMGRLVFG